jgi:hypothetical protein
MGRTENIHIKWAWNGVGHVEMNHSLGNVLKTECQTHKIILK